MTTLQNNFAISDEGYYGSFGGAYIPEILHNNIEELPQHFFSELRHFFEEYKALEKKSVKVEEFGDKAKAMTIVSEAIEFYKETFLK